MDKLDARRLIATLIRACSKLDQSISENICFAKTLLKVNSCKPLLIAKSLLKVNKMEQYLTDFNSRLRKNWPGSLVKVDGINEPHAKEYLNKLAKIGKIERVSWGWYWVPARTRSAQDFLRRDRNFKVLANQTAASYWNHDFVHRDVYVVKVNDRSYAKALEIFASGKGWRIQSIYTDEQLKYVSINGLHIENMEQAIVNCLKSYAFVDAFAAMNVNRDRIKIGEVERRYYWERLPHSDVRIRSILAYAWARIAGGTPRRIADDYVRRNIDDAVDKVVGVGQAD